MRFLMYNGPMQLGSPPAKVATGAATKTMLQVKLGVPGVITGWGYSFDGFAAAAPGVVELIEADNPATITAYVDADISKLDRAADAPLPSAAGFLYTTTGSGYSASNEGTTPTVVRNLDAPQLVAPTTQIIYQAPLGFEALIQANKFVRLRMTFAVTVNALCWLIIDT